MQLKRAWTQPFSSLEIDRTSYNNLYVVVYDFSKLGWCLNSTMATLDLLTMTKDETAITEFITLIKDLKSVGLHTEVRSGYDQSLLIFVQAPRELLGNTVYHAR